MFHLQIINLFPVLIFYHKNIYMKLTFLILFCPFSVRKVLVVDNSLQQPLAYYKNDHILSENSFTLIFLNKPF